MKIITNKIIFNFEWNQERTGRSDYSSFCGFGHTSRRSRFPYKNCFVSRWIVEGCERMEKITSAFLRSVVGKICYNFNLFHHVNFEKNWTNGLIRNILHINNWIDKKFGISLKFLNFIMNHHYEYITWSLQVPTRRYLIRCNSTWQIGLYQFVIIIHSQITYYLCLHLLLIWEYD